MADFEIKRGDTSPAIEARLVNAAGRRLPTDEVTSVTFRMRSAGDGLVYVSGAGTIDETTSVARYEWADGDTDTADLYHAEFELSLSDGTTRTVPSGEYIEVRVCADLGGSA